MLFFWYSTCAIRISTTCAGFVQYPVNTFAIPGQCETEGRLQTRESTNRTEYLKGVSCYMGFCTPRYLHVINGHKKNNLGPARRAMRGGGLNASK
ncbi:hypothetical protein BC834DRAFT_550500 [Gloeopeniophorella convolvens]|nr:hypothetical protein BC834DRAFT_550500 [Gloeopeniophorella convolvens]